MSYDDHDHEDDVSDLARELAGNWRKFSSFAWRDRPEEDGDDWAIVYTHGRDSDLLAESNAAVTDEVLAPLLGEDLRKERHSHWAVGWVDGYAIRVYGADRAVTAAFKTYAEQVAIPLADYPVLSDDDYGERQTEATIANIERTISRIWHNLDGDQPEGAGWKVFGWLWDNNQRAVERDSDGADPPTEAVIDALRELGLYPAEVTP